MMAANVVDADASVSGSVMLFCRRRTTVMSVVLYYLFRHNHGAVIKQEHVLCSMTCSGNLQEEQKYNFIPKIFTRWSFFHYDLGILQAEESMEKRIKLEGKPRVPWLASFLKRGVTPQNEITEWRKTTSTSYLNLPLWFQNLVWHPSPFWKGGSHPKMKLQSEERLLWPAVLNLPLLFRNGM